MGLGLTAVATMEIGNMSLGYAERSRYIPLPKSTGAEVSDSGYIGVTQLSHAMPFAVGVVLPTLAVHVVDILGLGAKEKMGRIDASSIVAAVADEHAVRDFPALHLPGNPMGRNLPGLEILGDLETPVAVRRGAPNPKPARARPAGSVHLTPESLGDRHSFVNPSRHGVQHITRGR